MVWVKFQIRTASQTFVALSQLNRNTRYSLTWKI